MEKVLVTWWFDVEDFVTPEADDAPKWIAEFFNKRRYKGTFKIVAEKARALRRRGRQDVIKAIAKQTVGFHMNIHSIHPTVYEYLKDKTWEAGCKEFERREGEGYRLIRKEFGRVACFGHPGPAWAAEAYPALAKWNIPVYLDSSSILTVNDKPYWYCNILNVQVGSNHLRVDGQLDGPDALEQLKKSYRIIYNRLRKTGPGIASIVIHPHTLVTKEFWDMLNFANGRNTPKSQYKSSLRPIDDASRRRRDFLEFVDHTASLPDSRVVDAFEAAEIYRDDAKTRRFNKRALLRIVSKTTRRVGYIRYDGFFLAPSEVLWLTASALAGYAERKRIPNNSRIIPIVGPSRRAETRGPRTLCLSEFLDASVSIRDQIRSERKVPDLVRIGPTTLSPVDYLGTSTKILQILLEKRKLPSVLVAQRARLENEKYINMSAFHKAFKWYVLPRGFKALNLIEHARLQTWTLKPAVPRK